MKRIILGVAAALFLSAGQAAADGLPSRSHVKAPDAAVGPNWNGFYIGVGLGAGALVADKPLSFYGEEFASTEYGGEGVFGTVTIGYDRVIRQGWVAGVFADYDFGSSISSDSNLSLIGPFSIDHKSSWAIGARLGFLANAGTLIYGTVGYTQAEFEPSAQYLPGLFRSPTFSGYFVGAGVETFLRDSWTLKLEYRYADYGSETVFGDPAYFGSELDPSTHTARLVLSYRFGGRD
jgi:outer membrane immunogenic protein